MEIQATRQMKYAVSKEFTFEAAHRLLENYSGKCNNNHGHSWVVKVVVEAQMLDNKGMVIDFQELKALKDWIDDNLDHTTILWENDPMCNYIRQSGQRIYTTIGNPTSERIGVIILEQAKRMFDNENIRVQSVEINETCTSGAVVFNC